MGGGGGELWGGEGVEREYKLRHHLYLCLIAQMEMKMKKVVGVFSPPFFNCCYHLDPAMANYKDMRGTNRLTHKEKHLQTYTGYTESQTDRNIKQKLSPWTQHAD